MKKQIEEMAGIVDDYYDTAERTGSELCGYEVAEALYNAGYRKQSEGEWKAGNENGQYGYYCSNCKAGFTGENAEWIAKEHDFCPKCGAKMKGANNGKAFF